MINQFKLIIGLNCVMILVSCHDVFMIGQNMEYSNGSTKHSYTRKGNFLNKNFSGSTIRMQNGDDSQILSVSNDRQPSRQKGYVVTNPNDFFDNGIYHMKCITSGKSIGIHPNINGDQVYQFGTKCSPEYTYQIIRLKNNEFCLKNQSNKAIITETPSDPVVHGVIFSKKSKCKDQKWKFIYTGNKEFHLKNVKSNLTLELMMYSNNDGIPLISFFGSKTGKYQRFSFTLVDFVNSAFPI